MAVATIGMEEGERTAFIEVHLPRSYLCRGVKGNASAPVLPVQGSEGQ